MSNKTILVSNEGDETVELISPIYGGHSYGSRMVVLSKSHALRYINRSRLRTAFFVKFHTNRLNNRQVSMFGETIFIKYNIHMENQLMKELTNIQLDDSAADIKIVNRLSLLNKFIRSDFSNRDRYADEDRVAYDNFKILSREKREEVIENLRLKLYIKAPQIIAD